MYNKKFLLAAFILISAGLFALLSYNIVKGYFRENPIVICNGSAFSDSCLIKSAVDLGIKKSTFIQCFQSNKYASQIVADQQLATTQGFAFGPALLAGVTDNSEFTGFYTGVTAYSELTDIITDISDNGVAKAQQDWAVTMRAKVEANLNDYLKSTGLVGAKLDEAYKTNQADVDQYMQSFGLQKFVAKEQNVMGNGVVTLVYFTDFGSSSTYSFAQSILVPLSADALLTGGARLVVKDLPAANELMDSKKLANAVRCAGEQNKYQQYFEYINSLQTGN